MHFIGDTNHSKYFGKGKKTFWPIVSIKRKRFL